MAVEKLHADEPDIDEVLARSLLRNQCQDIASLPITELKSAGTVNVIYRVGDDRYIRLPRSQEGSDGLEKELELLPRLAPHLPVAVPEPLRRGVPGNGYPYTWAVYRWLPGEPFDRLKARSEREAATDLAGFIDALRRIDPENGPRSGRLPLRQLDQRTRAAIVEVGTSFDAAALTAAWEHALEAPEWTGRSVWRHGDLLPPNVLAKDGCISAIIDFGGVGVGDPASDVIPAWSMFGPTGREAFRSALDVDEAIWRRARGYALHQALLIIPYYAYTNPDFTAMAKQTVRSVLDDLRL